MKNEKLIVFVALAVMNILAGCVDEKGKSSAPAKEEVKLPEGPVMTAEERNKDYTKDVIRYTMGTKDLGTWGYCLSLSSWAKQASEGEYTFLCPTDDALLIHDRRLVTELNLPENKKLLDKIMALHLLKGRFKYEDLLSKSEVETIDGQKLKVNTHDKTIDNVIFTKREVQSETLYLIVMEDLLRYPEMELKASAAKRLNQSANGKK